MGFERRPRGGVLRLLRERRTPRRFSSHKMHAKIQEHRQCDLTEVRPLSKLAAWKYIFSSDQIAQLARIAAHEGVETEELVKDAALRLLEDDASFRAAVRRGLDQADRGEFIEENEMDTRIGRMFPPR